MTILCYINTGSIIAEEIVDVGVVEGAVAVAQL